jgi:hypothetical protein
MATRADYEAGEALIKFLNRVWQEIAGDIYSNVTSNRQAVECVLDRAYDRMTQEQRASLGRGTSPGR